MTGRRMSQRAAKTINECLPLAVKSENLCFFVCQLLYLRAVYPRRTLVFGKRRLVRSFVVHTCLTPSKVALREARVYNRDIISYQNAYICRDNLGYWEDHIQFKSLRKNTKPRRIQRATGTGTSRSHRAALGSKGVGNGERKRSNGFCSESGRLASESFGL